MRVLQEALKHIEHYRRAYRILETMSETTSSVPVAEVT